MISKGLLFKTNITKGKINYIYGSQKCNHELGTLLFVLFNYERWMIIIKVKSSLNIDQPSAFNILFFYIIILLCTDIIILLLFTIIIEVSAIYCRLLFSQKF